MSWAPEPEDLLFDNLLSPLLFLGGSERLQGITVDRLNTKEAELVAGGQTPAQGIRGTLITLSGKAVRFCVWMCPPGIGCSFEGAGVDPVYHAAQPFMEPKGLLQQFLYQMTLAREA